MVEDAKSLARQRRNLAQKNPHNGNQYNQVKMRIRSTTFDNGPSMTSQSQYDNRRSVPTFPFNLNSSNNSTVRKHHGGYYDHYHHANELNYPISEKDLSASLANLAKASESGNSCLSF